MSWNPGRKMSLLRWSAGALVVGLAAAATGCGGEGRPNVGASYPVKGKVTLPDGKPLPRAKVVISGPVTDSVTTESDGTFAFKGDGAGLPAGNYKVRLEVGESKGSPRRPALPFPGKYLDEDTSDLAAVVKSGGPNDFDFKLTKAEGQGSAGAGKGAVRNKD
jgi:hypothetical protein